MVGILLWDVGDQVQCLFNIYTKQDSSSATVPLNSSGSTQCNFPLRKPTEKLFTRKFPSSFFSCYLRAVPEQLMYSEILPWVILSPWVFPMGDSFYQNTQQINKHITGVEKQHVLWIREKSTPRKPSCRVQYKDNVGFFHSIVFLSVYSFFTVSPFIQSSLSMSFVCFPCFQALSRPGCGMSWPTPANSRADKTASLGLVLNGLRYTKILNIFLSG